MSWRNWWWPLIGRRYGPQRQILCYRAWWLAAWEPVKVIKRPLTFLIDQAVLDDMHEQIRRDAER